MILRKVCETQLFLDSLPSNRVKVPKINLGSIHGDNKSNLANDEILTDTLNQFDAASIMRSSNRAQGLKTVQRPNERSMLQSLPSPNLASEFEPNNTNNQGRQKTTVNMSKAIPAASATENIKGK